MDINLEIQNFPFWDKLNETEKRMMINGATYRKYDKNQMVYGYSDACLGIIYVKKGGIRVYTTSEDGREVTFFHIEEGDFCILSASCVIGQMMIDVQLLADEETELLAIHSGTFAQVMDNNIYVKAFAFELSTTRMTSVVWVMQQILFDHFDERLARFLLSVYEKTGEKKIKMTQEYMAQEVNSAREVVARMLKQFASDGWIEINRGAITLKDIEALENLVK
ncbi:MAG: Crp/Fnr family transcriptional regulator [Lachnospiraceae bacterium]|nr:Crp/Fnr family transcriptional regulator [Lachnospiraceae bacterium]